MLVLAINSCLPACDAAIGRFDESGQLEVLAQNTEQMRRGQDARLPGFVSELCDAAGIELPELGRIAVVTGPGSFTGIRIGVAFARGLSLGFSIPVVGLTSLEAGTDKNASGLFGFAAQKRPPDRTWWVQCLQNGLGTDEVIEHSEADLPVGAFQDVEPSAVHALQKALLVSPESHPASPVYARLPDAAPPKTPSVSG